MTEEQSAKYWMEENMKDDYMVYDGTKENWILREQTTCTRRLKCWSTKVFSGEVNNCVPHNDRLQITLPTELSGVDGFQ